MTNSGENICSVTPGLWKRLQGDGVGAILARGASASFVVAVVGAVMAFGTNVLLARLMGATQYGIYIYVLTWINLLAIVCHLGLKTSLLRYIPTYNAKQDWPLFRGILGHSVQYVVLASLIVSVIVAFIVWFIKDRIGIEHAVTFWIALFLLPLLGVTGLRQAVLRSLKYIFKSGLPDSFFRPMMIIVLSSSFYFYTHENLQATYAMGINLIGAIVSFIIGTVWLLKVLPEQLSHAQPKYSDREWLMVSLPLFFMSGMTLIQNNTDIIMIGLMLDTEQAGVYAIASRIAGLIVFGLTAANTIVAPMISELYSTGQYQKLQRMITLAARGIGLFTLIISISMAIVGEYMLGLFGDEFVNGYVPLLILIAGQMINAFAGSVGFLMTMTGHHMQAAKIVGVSALLNIFANAMLIPVFGLMGAAIATATTTVIWNLMMLVYVWRKMSINPTILARI